MSDLDDTVGQNVTAREHAKWSKHPYTRNPQVKIWWLGKNEKEPTSAIGEEFGKNKVRQK
jgi:hypothetical protein